MKHGSSPPAIVWRALVSAWPGAPRPARNQKQNRTMLLRDVDLVGRDKQVDASQRKLIQLVSVTECMQGFLDLFDRLDCKRIILAAACCA
jgi:hypothetical protein